MKEQFTLKYKDRWVSYTSEKQVYIVYASLRIMLLLLHDPWIQHHVLGSTLCAL